MAIERGEALEDFRPTVRSRIAALWAATMFCYVYGDYFGLFRRGQLADMNAGKMGPLGVATPAVLVAVSVMMAIPSAMVFLSLVLPPRLCRWINILLGVVYTVIMVMTMRGSQPFYMVLGALEIALTLAIVSAAWTWPRMPKDGFERRAVAGDVR